MRKIISGNRIEIGCCYYPEQWDKSLWEEDLRRMLKSGIKTIRIAEFAWNFFEPYEGKYTFDFFDEFLDLCTEVGMDVIFCTPTATPPAWLTLKYPETLNADICGTLIRHGARRQYNYNSLKYREFCGKIVEQIAAHYSKHPAVVGWQIDNELNCENDLFYSAADNTAFREFLKEKYQDLDELNRAWGTVFWNQTYTAWEEVFVPRKTNTGVHNPHQQLDYYRFISNSTLSFLKLQADIIKKYKKPDSFITTNGLFGHVDYQKMVKESINMIMYDSYPDYAYCPDDYKKDDFFKDRGWSRNLSETRAISPNFGIMEQQSGPNGWTNSMDAPAPRPGQIRLWTMQSIAHGADYVSYFRWRTATFGTEIYWHGILDYSGRDNRRLKEITQIGEDVNKLSDIAGSRYTAEVGILKDYDNIWDTEVDKWHRRVEAKSQKSLFAAMQKTHTPFDYVYLNRWEKEEETLAKLKKYKVLFYPHASIMDSKTADILVSYVEDGGKLVMCCRTGYKNMFGHCIMDKLPGMVSTLTGTDILEYTLVPPDEGPCMAKFDDDEVGASEFSDLLKPIGDNAEVLATYMNTYYEGTPALIRNRVKNGEAYYFGGALEEDTVIRFLKELKVLSPFDDCIMLPKECELAVRSDARSSFIFVLNYMSKEVKIEIRKPMTDMLTDEEHKGEYTLKPYEVLILRKQ